MVPTCPQVGLDLRDNRWHWVELRYEMGSLRLRLDASTDRLVASASVRPRLLNLTPSPPVLMGENFTGCLQGGAGLPLGAPRTVADGAAQWGPCPLPDTGHCGEDARRCGRTASLWLPDIVWVAQRISCRKTTWEN